MPWANFSWLACSSAWAFCRSLISTEGGEQAGLLIHQPAEEITQVIARPCLSRRTSSLCKLVHAQFAVQLGPREVGPEIPGRPFCGQTSSAVASQGLTKALS